MAIYTKGRSAGITIGMTAGTLSTGMCTGEREAGVVVIEAGRLPGRLSVAGSTIVGVTGRLVVRIGGIIIVIDVAAHTSIGGVCIVSRCGKRHNRWQ